MSPTLPDEHNDPLDHAPTDVLHCEVRRQGKVVAVFRGVRSGAGITIETRVYPTTGAHNQDNGVNRPFSFPAIEQARKFVDETLVALEYLGCTVA